ncbi:uncharacterized protein LOC126848662 [Cataglyphis hispanica]|uniref:uncharacterized protein LOC126848662 n=1 Tax=Cataglyphis hispanica TaxID=1086592 RepID=UPI00217F4879|nr:uncharacterized protein LOC126848662 [Cataglyphis hispanica]XP_050445664.1 uncharacterized protein LOC126848662 [Cataglyphis hispanica]XP_050445665.1 uncharacterized protein LOC126848662 [Cataglyphis hispanica]XP_050445666.1 uncharacterized protein LOC126848662 [Cataglyphis hispanica]XP_050445667.1 uncharacterized protein LOC126848662 [Cataglyphis hispanica]XP_050445668.1 uncharacterized protein LOC126848662 [Cataglyphis hispanica]XP_050445669.1 uncharacterized protein LOC126848662 [Catagl
MSSSGEFSTLSSGEATGTGEDSLPSSREATAEAAGSGGGFMPLREFLDRFSLPRVVRVEGAGGRPILLYKQQQKSLRVTATLLMHRYRHDVKVGPEIVIPEGYPGWFSVVSNNSGTGNARVYRRVGALVRAGVPAFLLAKPLRAYTLTHSKMENGNLRAHYTKTTVRAGEVLRLTAVFQDTRRAPVASGVSGMIPEGKSSRSSERDQYAQCLDSHGHELFAPLSARGEFYAICQSGSLDTGSDAVLYRVHQLARRDLPLRVRLVAGPLPIPLPRDYSGLMQLENANRGPIVLGCAVPLMPERPLPNSTVPELLELVATGPTAPRVKRARLGCPSEARLLASPKMQRLLSACRRALDQRATEPRVAPPKPASNNSQLKELHLKEIKAKPEAKPILQSLKEGLEHIKKTTIRDRSSSRSVSNNNSFLDRISRIAQGNRSRNPAKKSASFTFAVRPEIGMRSPERYASLESETNLMQAAQASSRQQVQRSISTSVLEVLTSSTDMDPPYSKVRDSLTPLPPTPPPKPEEIYAEICELGTSASSPLRDSSQEEEKLPSAGKTGTRERDRGYVKLALSHSEISDISASTGDDEEGIYNTVC